MGRSRSTESRIDSIKPFKEEVKKRKGERQEAKKKDESLQEVGAT